MDNLKYSSNNTHFSDYISMLTTGDKYIITDNINLNPSKTKMIKKITIYVKFYLSFPLNFFHIFSGVIGISSISSPTALNTALPTAGATPSIGISATAFTPNG